MNKVVLKQKAIEDLNSIWIYTVEHWSVKQAEIYYNSFKTACEKIKKKPSIGKNYELISKNLKGLKHKQHILFYRQITTHKIEIIRILHQKMDFSDKLNK